MDWKTLGIRIAGLIIIAAAGQFLYAIAANGLIMLDLMPAALGDKGFGYALTQKTLIVWAGSVLLAIGSLFIKENWRYVFYFCPLYAPVIFAVIFTLMHHTPDAALSAAQ